jgi:arginine utilization protein RocB
MSPALKVGSVLVSAALVTGALAIGGGVPLAPEEVSDATGQAADNARIAATHTERAARYTEALAAIARNVRSQVETSHRLLATQLRLEESARVSGRRSTDLQRGLAGVQSMLARFETKLGVLTRLSSTTTSDSEASARAASHLLSTLRALERRFQVVTRQSRELNRKARGFDEIRDGPA